MIAAYKLIVAGLAMLATLPKEQLKVLDTYSGSDATGSPDGLMLLRTNAEFTHVWTTIHGANSRINGITYSADPAPEVNFKKEMVLFVPVASDSPAGEFSATAVKDAVHLTFKPYPTGGIKVAAAGGNYTFVFLSKFTEEFTVKNFQNGRFVEVARFPKVSNSLK